MKNFTSVVASAIITIFLLLGVKSYAQPGDVNGISARLVEINATTMEMQLQANNAWDWTDGVVNLTFAIRWETSAGGTLGNPSQTGLGDPEFCMLQGIPLAANSGINNEDVGGFRYKGFNANGNQLPEQCAFAANVWIPYARMSISGLTGCATFVIVTSDDFTDSMNSNWFISLGGTNITANSPVVGPGVQLGACDADCAGVVGGTASIDDCDVCSGGTTGITPNSTCADCAGVPNGTASIDDCDVCSGGTTGITPNSTCADCAGVPNGTASIDDCDVCSGGTTGITPNSTCADCAGVPNGTASIDDCDVCSGGTTGITPNSTCADCAGVPNGTASIDDCDVCSGGTTGITPNSTCADCAGVPNGTAEIDECGVCAGGTTGNVPNESCTDCNGVVNGTAFIDDCETCVGGNTGLTPCGDDCAGVPGGTASVDQCGVCSGGTTGIIPNSTCTDCAGVINGSAAIDDCGVCSGGTTGIDPNSTCSDCNGDVNGTAEFDECGVCAGGATGNVPNASCTDCNGVVNGTAFIDDCETCVGGNTGLTPCGDDCAGVSGGTASVDQCGVCSGGTTGIEPNSTCTDCAGVINGSASIDDCEVCSGGTTGIDPNSTCTDCNGDVNGTAEVDDCGVCAGGTTGNVPNESCTDCNGVVNGTAFLDNCGDCVGGNTGMEPCEADCAGVAGGTAFLDNCGICVGGTTGLDPCVADCHGDFGGTAFFDNCGDCVGGNTGEEPCVPDCNGDFGGSALPGTPCNDPEPGTWSSECVCEPTGPVYDCPSLEANIGDTCDDNNEFTDLDTVNSNCECVGIVTGDCTEFLTIELQTDGAANQTSWAILSEGSMISMCDGDGYPDNSVVTDECCLPVGCYVLQVYDSAGDGMTTGTTGGYILRTFPDDKRIIDNRYNFNDGFVSAISGDQGFCLPLGDDRIIHGHCDKLSWLSGEFIAASLNTEVSAEWVDNAPNSAQSTTTGYQFWFFDPNGSYSFRRFRSHATSDGYPATGPARAAHLRINNWGASNHIPEQMLLNVKVRSRVNGVNSEWGPACRFAVDPVAAACPMTKLNNLPGHPYLSCDQYKNFTPNQYIWALPVNGATQYQFRFRLPAEQYEVIRTNTTYNVRLYWTVPPPLVEGSQYEVDVRAFKNGQWCPWGEVCTLNIGTAPGLQGGTQNSAMVNEGHNETIAELTMWPNPNNGDRLNINLSELPAGVSTVSVDIFDLFGKRVLARSIATTDGYVNISMDLTHEVGLAGGMYVVNITAREKVYSQRLVIQR